MKVRNNRSGFTLLEIIIVIIIVGVLASLALPRFFATVEFSKSTEALTAMATIRQSMERCWLMANQDYTNCGVGTPADFTQLDIEDPANSPNAHFTYAIAVGADPSAEYTITATRNASDGGDGASTIQIDVDAAGITRSGTGVYSGIK